MVLSAVGVHRRMMVSEAPAAYSGLVMSTTRSIRAWRLMAATVPTRWPVPRPDEGRPSAAAGGSRGFAIRCSCRVGLLCRLAELAAVAQHAMEDDDVLDNMANFGAVRMALTSPGQSGRRSEPHQQ
jgi:hypothetical protein